MKYYILSWTFFFIFFLSFVNLLAQGDDQCHTCFIGSHCTPDPNAGTSASVYDYDYNIRDIWGEKKTLIIKSAFTFDVYNATNSQLRIIEQSLEVLPNEYLEVLPANFRVGNPMRLNSKISPPGEHIFGGSKFCQDEDIPDQKKRDYESIVLHEGIFTDPNKMYRTILHECGHFIDKYLIIANQLSFEQKTLCSTYLDEIYNGRTSSISEVIAQGIMYFFYKRNFDRRSNRRLAEEDLNYAFTSSYPEWLHNIINTHFQENTSH